jgi:hypothetical protein
VIQGGCLASGFCGAFYILFRRFCGYIALACPPEVDPGWHHFAAAQF